MSSSVRQISITSEPDRTFFLKLDWAEDLGAGFVVILSDGVSAWTGEVSEEDVTQEAQEMEVQREKYVQDLQLALTGTGPEGEYSFHLSASDSERGAQQLSYDKVQKDISFSLGSVDLQPIPDPVETIRDLISYGLRCNGELRTSNTKLQEENRQLRKEQEHITAELERYVQGKEVLEKDLYTRFVLVLNEKKDKIRRQQETIESLRMEMKGKEARGSGGSSAKDKPPPRRAAPALSPSTEEDEYAGSTDDEHNEGSVPEEPVKERSQSPLEDSLKDIIDVAPTRKHRQRHLQVPPPKAKDESSGVQAKKRKEEPHAKAKTSEKPLVQPPAKSPALPDVEDLFDDI